MNTDHKTAKSEDICKGRVFFHLVMFVLPNNRLAEGNGSVQFFIFIFFLFSLLHRACCRVTQLQYQLLHVYKFYMCAVVGVVIE